VLGWIKRKLDPKAQLLAALGEAELPTFPTIVLEGLRQLRDPQSSLRDVGATLSADPGVSVQLLKLTNSPAFATRHPVRSVEHAVSLLGRATVESALLTVGTSSALAPSIADGGLDAERFWSAAALRAATARAFASLLHPSTGATSFTAALLSDMAVPLLASARRDVYPELLAQAGAGAGALHVLEREALGFDHGGIGGALCVEWAFPSTITDAVGGHHECLDDETLPAAVRLASLLADTDVGGHDAVVDAARDGFGVPADDVVALLDEARSEAGAIAASFRLPVSRRASRPSATSSGRARGARGRA